ncbi:hypothetical protein ACFQFQ_13650 [Sulfitobacter porphyrae]|jgi:hypothetical protein|uniref:Uncharacterized protein n=1 Tax=Sulfitobacter porphyrae TaxID=1246864 RepID=A0ABW2B3Z3_9RHOB|nr:hypothetical protein GCM10007928_00470 [Sulfitobacter porphyrae]
MRRLSFAAVSVAILTGGLSAASAAPSYEAVNHLKVHGISPTSFEVIEALGEGARGMWCAAADYAIHQLGVAATQRLYVKSPRGRSQSYSGRVGVVFTTDASSLPTEPSRSVAVRVDTPGLGLPVYHANQFCRDFLLEFETIRFRRGLN